MLSHLTSVTVWAWWPSKQQLKLTSPKFATDEVFSGTLKLSNEYLSKWIVLLHCVVYWIVVYWNRGVLKLYCTLTVHCPWICPAHNLHPIYPTALLQGCQLYAIWGPDTLYGRIGCKSYTSNYTAREPMSSTASRENVSNTKFWLLAQT